MSLKKWTILAFSLVSSIVLLSLSSQVLETNNEGYYQIKQAFGTGNMTVRSTPGTYWQGMGAIYTYQLSDMYYFSNHQSENNRADATDCDAVRVRFNDGGNACITGSIKFRLSGKVEDQLQLHRDFKSFLSVKQDLIRQVVTESLMQTAALMRAEESYSTRRSEFTALAEEQVKLGIFDTISQELKEVDAGGNEFVEMNVLVKTDKYGNRLVRKHSPLQRYNIEVLQFVVQDIDFDKTIDALISKKKEAEQQKVVAKANAERAKQDAITEREQGAARIAKAKADEEVEKIKAVTQALKQYEVSVQNRKQAEEEGKAKVFQGEAEAKVAKLKVAAGLSPKEAAEFRMNTSIGVAEKLANVRFPSMMVIGGSSNGSALNPFDAVGLESFIRISDKLSNKNEKE